MSFSSPLSGPHEPGSSLAEAFDKYFRALTQAMVAQMNQKNPGRNYTMADVWPTFIRYLDDGMHGVGFAAIADEDDIPAGTYDLDVAQLEMTHLGVLLSQLAPNQLPLALTVVEVRRLLDLVDRGKIVCIADSRG